VKTRSPIVLITGVGRGISFELVRQYLADGATVVAATRAPVPALESLEALGSGHIIPLSLDVSDQESVDSAAAILSNYVPQIDILYNNAGVAGINDRLADFSAEELLRVMRVNTIAPLMVARAFHPLLLAAGHARILTLVSRIGALFSTKPEPGSGYAYAISKAALHRALKMLAADFRKDGIISVGIDPGFVETDMTRGFAGQRHQLMPEQSVSYIRRVAAALTQEHSGCFMRWNGRICRWLAPSENAEDMQMEAPVLPDPFVLDSPVS
jgi:NAD(P)-dependent dehydrogenase (short-subunit alcohol dehydrogenase family)